MFDQLAETLFSPHYCRPVLLRMLSEETWPPDSHKAGDSLYFLHPKERETFSGYKLAKRRAEYLTGRACAKLAIQHYCALSQQGINRLEIGQIAIFPGTDGRPVITQQPTPQIPALEISISHSRKYAVAAVSRQHCGIDIQYLSETLLRVQEKYCAPEEDRLLRLELPGHKQLARLATLWAAKEAVQKNGSHRKMPGFQDIELKELKEIPTHSSRFHLVFQVKGHSAHHNYPVAATLFDDYALALSIKGNSQNARTARG